MRLHLDTDFGGDPDDLCALAMLLGWPGVELTGITTTIDPDGWRAAYLEYCLGLAGRQDIPVVAGAGVSLTTRRIAQPFLDDARYWPTYLTPRPSSPGAAIDLLHRSVEAGATIVGIGPFTNLALLEVSRSGTLARVPVVVMGGWVRPPASGLPAWGPSMDFNVQWDTHAAMTVAETADALTLVTLPATLKAPLRTADLPRLRAAGPLGELITNQSTAYAGDRNMAALGRAHATLPDDLLNFHYDPVACAVALGWPGVTLKEERLRTVLEGDVLRFQPDPEGRPRHTVSDVDGARFTEAWLTAVGAAHG